MGVKMKIISIFISFLFLSFSLNADTIKYWTTEEQPARMMKQVQMAVDFNKLLAIMLLLYQFQRVKWVKEL